MARAGSKGLPGKCMRELLGRPVIAYTFEHARASKLLTDVVFSTDSEPAKAIAREAGIEVVDRPAELASDTATVDAAARHAVEEWERRHAERTPLGPPLVRGEARRVDAVALLYGNIPIRAEGLIDRAIEHLVRTGADSVRSVAPVSKQHPDWVHRLDGDHMVQFRANSIYRRQDLESLYYHDGAIAVVTRAALFGALETPDDHQSFLGRDRRAIVCRAEDAVDIDGPVDLLLAEAVLRGKQSARGPVDCRLSIVDCRLGNDEGLRIAEHSIKAGGRTFIVAEAGVNHNGSVETALQMVDAAADADAIKFQMFRATELTTVDAPTAAYQRQRCGEESQQAMLSKLELTLDDFRRIRRRCEERSILFLATPFSTADVARVIEFGVAAIKIASTDLTNGPLLDAAMATGLPLIVSTGAATEEEIGASVDRLVRGGASQRLILLHCVSCYPTPIEAANLRAIAALQREFGVPVGLSDHTTSAETGGWAVAAGACVLEKHFTLDRTAAGPDQAMSLTPPELAEYVRQVRAVEAALGDGTVGMTQIEEEVRVAARKSVVSAVAIRAGTRLARSMLTLKRPGTGIRPDELPMLVWRHAATDIPSDTLLSWEMVR